MSLCEGVSFIYSVCVSCFCCSHQGAVSECVCVCVGRGGGDEEESWGGG